MTTEQALVRATEMLGPKARVLEAPDGAPYRFIVGRLEESDDDNMFLGLDVWGRGESWEEALQETEGKAWTAFREAWERAVARNEAQPHA